MMKIQLVIILVVTNDLFLGIAGLANAKPQESERLTLYFDTEIGDIQPKKASYLGSRGGGSNIFDFKKIENNLEQTAYGLGIGYQILTPDKEWSRFLNGLNIIGHAQNGRAHTSENFASLNLGGDTLIVPGTGVGSNGIGFELAGPFNQIENAQYKSRFSYHSLMIAVESYIGNTSPALNIKPLMGIRYSSSIIHDTFSGDIPLFLRDFQYNTKIRTQSVSPTLGLNIDYQAHPFINIFAGGEYSYDINNGHGSDSLFFSGEADQTAAIGNYNASHSTGIKTGITFTPSPGTAFTLQGNYKRWGNIPAMNIRNGANPSRFSYEKADVYSATARLIFKF